MIVKSFFASLANNTLQYTWWCIRSHCLWYIQKIYCICFKWIVFCWWNEDDMSFFRTAQCMLEVCKLLVQKGADVSVTVGQPRCSEFFHAPKCNVGTGPRTMMVDAPWTSCPVTWRKTWLQFEDSKSTINSASVVAFDRAHSRKGEALAGSSGRQWKAGISHESGEKVTSLNTRSAKSRMASAPLVLTRSDSTPFYSLWSWPCERVRKRVGVTTSLRHQGMHLFRTYSRQRLARTFLISGWHYHRSVPKPHVSRSINVRVWP